MKDRRDFDFSHDETMNDWVFAEPDPHARGTKEASEQGREDADIFVEKLEKLFEDGMMANSR